MLSNYNDDAAELALMNALIKSLHMIPLSIVNAHVEQTAIAERLQTYKRRRISHGSSFKYQKKN
jgi:hypothetical protein